MKNQASFSLKDKSKKIKMSSAAIFVRVSRQWLLVALASFKTK